MAITEAEPVWCAIANVAEPGNSDFSPGAKVYISQPNFGWGSERVEIIGLHRRSHRYIKIWISSKLLENSRVKQVYKPALVERLSGQWDNSEESKDRARRVSELINTQGQQ